VSKVPERVFHDRLWPNVRYYVETYQKGLRKTTRRISRGSRSAGRELNPRPHEY
jgi:hypothetical protein